MQDPKARFYCAQQYKHAPLITQGEMYASDIIELAIQDSEWRNDAPANATVEAAIEYMTGTVDDGYVRTYVPLAEALIKGVSVARYGIRINISAAEVVLRISMYDRPPKTLDALCERLIAGKGWWGAPTDWNNGELIIDWMKLPTFGGDEPDDMIETWSWDETRKLVGKLPSDLRIVDREQVENNA